LPPAEQVHNKKKPWLKPALITLKLLISLGLLAFLIHNADIDLHELRGSLAKTDPLYVFLALLTPYAGFFITSLRWKGLLDVQGVQIRQPVLFRSCMVAVFFNQIMPSTIGGDMIRMYDSWKAGATRAVAISTIVVDRVLGLFALAIFAVLGLFFVRGDFSEAQYVPLAVVAVAMGLGGFIALVFSPFRLMVEFARAVYTRLPGPFGKFFGKVDRAVEPFRGKHSSLTRALGLSLVLQLNVVLMHYLLSRAIGIELGFIDYFYVVPVALFVMLIPISINGIGVRENMFVFLLGTMGVAKADALLLSLLAFAVFLVHGLMGGLVLASRGISPAQLAKDAATPTPGAAA
jgi:hypothetical protein